MSEPRTGPHRDWPGNWYVVVPGDPEQRTGGYNYVRQVVAELTALGEAVSLSGLPGHFPEPDAEAATAMDTLLASIPEQSLVVLDGLAMGAMPDLLARHQGRLNLISLVHHPLADETGLSPEEQDRLKALETRALAAVSGVITTSEFTATRLAAFQVPPDRIRVVAPGVAHRQPTVRTDTNSPALLCVASLTPRKAQDQLITALAELTAFPWYCTLVGSPGRAPAYAAGLVRQINDAGLAGRVHLAGELSDRALDQAFVAADGFVLPSLYEGYGMVVDEALSYGLPVIASNGGALRHTADRPGVRQYEAGNRGQLADTLRVWLTSPDALAADQRAASRTARALRSWADTGDRFRHAVIELAAASGKRTGTRDKPHAQSSFDHRWLALREPADHRSRSITLTRTLADWLARQPTGGKDCPARVDIGSGTGSNGRYLMPELGGAWWVLVDQDANLLARARETLTNPDADTVIDLWPRRLSGNDFGTQVPARIELITASALIDLMSAAWLGALADLVADRQCALLIVLSYTGDVSLSPPHPDDDAVFRAINEHQHRDKGEGAALGPDATVLLAERLKRVGFRVEVRDSPWLLDGNDRALQLALIEGWRQAAREQQPLQTARVRQWAEDRLVRARAGELGIRVGHQDLLALPADDGHDR